MVCKEITYIRFVHDCSRLFNFNNVSFVLLSQYTFAFLAIKMSMQALAVLKQASLGHTTRLRPLGGSSKQPRLAPSARAQPCPTLPGQSPAVPSTRGGPRDSTESDDRVIDNLNWHAAVIRAAESDSLSCPDLHGPGIAAANPRRDPGRTAS